MNTKTFLGISLATVFAVSIMGSAYAVLPSWLGLDGIGAEPKDDITKLTASATDDIPRRTGQLAGFAWFYDDGPNTAFAITIHSGDVPEDDEDLGDFADNNARNDFRDSTQNPDGWHAHNVILAVNENSEIGGTHCILDLRDAPNVGISFKGDDISVKVENSELTGALAGNGAAFPIIIDPSCPGTLGTEGYLDGQLGGPAPLGLIADVFPAA